MERIKISSHHVEAIKRDFNKLMTDEDIRRLSEQFLNEMKEGVIPFVGLPAYPGFLEPDNFNKALEVKITAVKAVLANEFEEIPDFNLETGNRKYDLICEACPNLDRRMSIGCRLDFITSKGMTGTLD